MMTETGLPLLGGLALLLAGGELLVRGAVQAATRLGVSPLVIGLTLVGFGTSAPELVASVQAAHAGAPGIAYGNVVGSNIANVLLIVGVAALLRPIVVSSSALRRDGLAMLTMTALFALLAATVPFGRLVGLGFVVALLAYIWLAFRQERQADLSDHGAVHHKSAALGEADPALGPVVADDLPTLPRALLTAVVGLALVVAGGKFLVDGAVALARDLDIAETVIGLTVVAVGTSMPELVTSCIAAFRRQSDVAFGNVVGSNIYNLLGIGGATALVAPGEVPERIARGDNLVVVAVSALLVVFAYTGLRIGRREGAALLAGYVVYLAWLWPR